MICNAVQKLIYYAVKKELITNPNHYVLEAAHPSPLSASRGFMGCGHFKKANEITNGKNDTLAVMKSII